MATTSKPSAEESTRELVPFRLRTADGREVELEYSSPRPAEAHDERAVLETLPWFEPGKPLRNWMLHETDLYDEVEQIWGRRWGAEGIGTLREVLVSRPTENEIFPPMVSQMVKIGEETGELEKMLGKIADFYEDEVDAAIQSLTSIIEPVMMIAVGCMVGVIIISMYLPMFKLLTLVK